MKIIFSQKCLEYDFPWHPESPRRVEEAASLLKNKNFDFIEPKAAAEEDLLRVHTKAMVERVRAGIFLDADTPNSKKMYAYALLSCAAAIKAQELALEGEDSFSLMRPPGHHATRTSPGGFCYFNNIAVAAAKALDRVKKVVIIDIDCHHGNGTQDIFLGESRVLYVSLHQSPLYPGTGLKSDGNCHNFPLPAGTQEKGYLEVLSAGLAEIKDFSPDLIAVSAGFDTYKNDPLTGFSLEKTTYAKISKLIFSLNKPVFSVLEGGYSEELGECIEQYCQA